jgi:hypothetical protein
MKKDTLPRTKIPTKKSVKLKNSKYMNGFAQLEHEIHRLYHELDVYKVELEMQNEELIKANKQAEIVAAKYLEWFDFAPIAYFSLSREGSIKQLNNVGATLLGNKQSILNDKLFGLFVSNNTKMLFNQFLSKIFNDFTRQNCEIILIPTKGSPINICLTGIISKDLSHCLVTAVDKTEPNCQLELLSQI